MTHRIFPELIEFPLHAPRCVNCAHFHRHYVQDSAKPHTAVPLNMGHCSYPRLKDRTTTDTCKHFTNKED